ncbi:putative integral membrane protein [Brugia pahangi]
MFVVPMMWFHTLFISKLFPKYKEYLSWSNLSLRLSLAAVLNLAISALVFQTSHIGYFEKFLCYAKECIKLRKMYELWPPHRHAVFYLIYSALVHCAIRYCLHVTKDGKKNELRPFYRKYLHSVLLSTLIFMLTLHVQRINELHFAIIVLNYVHTLVAGAVVTFICI